MTAVGQPLVLVTGGTGFLGRHLVSHLVESGWAVRLAVRSATDSEFDQAVVGDITGRTNWAEALRGVEAVIHLAARAHRPQAVQEKEQDLYFETNTSATANLARSAARGGIRHFIFLSSIAVNGSNSEGRRAFSEDDIPAPKTIYAASKARAEENLKTICEASAKLTIVRTPLIYGRSAKGNFSRLLWAIRSGIPVPFGLANRKRAFVAVDNVISFLLHRLSGGGEHSGTFIVADDEQVSTSEFIRRLASVIGRPARLLSIPPIAVYGLARLAGRGEYAESIFSPLEVTTSKAYADGWRPSVSLDEGLERATRSIA